MSHGESGADAVTSPGLGLSPPGENSSARPLPCTPSSQALGGHGLSEVGAEGPVALAPLRPGLPGTSGGSIITEGSLLMPL